MNPTLDRYLSARQLDELPAEDNEILSFWEKALSAHNDARNYSVSLHTRLLCAYDAGRLAALAIVRAAGYRPHGSERHHHVTFDVARSLAGTRELADALFEMNALRSLRHAVEYEPYTGADAEAVASAISAATQVINLGAKYLRAERVNLGKRIHMVKP